MLELRLGLNDRLRLSEILGLNDGDKLSLGLTDGLILGLMLSLIDKDKLGDKLSDIDGLKLGEID